MRRFILYAAGIIVFCAFGVLAFSHYARKAPQTTVAPYDAQLAACHAYPNGSTERIAETSRVTIYLPRALYPNQNGPLTFSTESGTAKAGWISNAGPAGRSYGATAGCFAAYYEFNGSGVVDLMATSSLPGVPAYIVHFSVGSTTTPRSSSGKGAISGTVLLGPTCPVEHNPPYPQCAPRPYRTTVAVYQGADASVFASTQSSANGSFILALPPGKYLLRAGGVSYFPRCSPVQVSVATDKTANVTITCDTGIR